MNILLVTGSRTLARRPEWLELTHCFEAQLAPLIELADLVVAGDATGPDEWALSLARNASRDYERWRTDGFVTQSARPHAVWRWHEGAKFGTFEPLARNAAMVQRCGECASNSVCSVLCVGFVDPQSRTHGTDHTLGLARRAGIWTARYVWRNACFVEES